MRHTAKDRPIGRSFAVYLFKENSHLFLKTEEFSSHRIFLLYDRF